MEPERKIEKLLRVFAKKRRDDAGDFKLHPATRRLLQSEVARRVPKEREGKGFSAFFSMVRPGFIYATCALVMIFMGAALLLPGLSKAKMRSTNSIAMNNLKQIGVASKEFAEENNKRLPQSLTQIQPLAGSNALVDPASGKLFVYVGGGRSVDSLKSDSVLAYSPEDERSRAVLFADGHVETVSRTRFGEITNRGLLQLAVASPSARREIAELPAPMGAPAKYGEAAGETQRLLAPQAPMLATSGSISEKSKIQSQVEDRKTFPTAGAKVANDQALFDAPVAVTAAPPPATVATWNGIPKTESVAPGQSGSNFRSQSNDGFASRPGGAATQKFSQAANQQTAQNIFKNAVAASKPTPVLANFQFEQNGSTVAVVDEDGSVYNGYLIAAAEGKSQNESMSAGLSQTKSPSPQQKVATKKIQSDNKDSDKEVVAVENYFFRVSGTNLSLQQNVVFTGNVVVFSNNKQASQNVRGSFNRFGSGGGNALPALEKGNSQQLGVFSNSRIAGVAIVNNTNTVEIEALPVAP